MKDIIKFTTFISMHTDAQKEVERQGGREKEHAQTYTVEQQNGKILIFFSLFSASHACNVMKCCYFVI